MSRGTVRTRTAAGVLTDVVREGPVDRHQARTRRIFFWGVLLVVVVLIVLGAVNA